MGILRFLLALSVLTSHFGPVIGLDFIGGQLAVQSFFMISGFYMSMILNEKYTGKNSSFKLFITNRLLRLYPLYGAVLIFSLATCLFIGFTNTDHHYPVFENYYDANTGFLSCLFLCFSQLFIIGQDLVMFLGIQPDSGSLFFTSNFWNTSPQLYTFLLVPQAWSLALEFTFYLIAPLLLRKKTGLICAVVGLSLVLRFMLYYTAGLQNDPWTYRFFPTEIVFFLIGSLGYKFYIKIKVLKFSSLLGYMLSIALITFILKYPQIPLGQRILFQYSLKDAAYLAMVAFSIPFLFVAFKKSGLDAAIGELSYPIYISHLLMAKICWLFHADSMHTPLFIALATIIFSVILNQSITKPIERYRQNRLINQQKNESLPNEAQELSENSGSAIILQQTMAGVNSDN